MVVVRRPQQWGRVVERLNVDIAAEKVRDELDGIGEIKAER